MISLGVSPAAMNELMHKLGVPRAWRIIEYDIQQSMPVNLGPVARQPLAFILIYQWRNDKLGYLGDVQPKPDNHENGVDPNQAGIWFMNQSDVSHAGGFIALLNALLNNLDLINLDTGTLKFFYERTKDDTPQERRRIMEETDNEIVNMHNALLIQRPTITPLDSKRFYSNSLVYIEKNGYLYELDARSSKPTRLIPTTRYKLPQDVAEIHRLYEKRYTSLNFSTFALIGT